MGDHKFVMANLYYLSPNKLSQRVCSFLFMCFCCLVGISVPFYHTNAMPQALYSNYEHNRKPMNSVVRDEFSNIGERRLS